MNQLDGEYFLQYVKKMESVGRMQDMTPAFHEKLQDTVEKEENIIFSSIGRTGFGKTTSTMSSLLEICDLRKIKFKLEWIAADGNELLQKIQKAVDNEEYGATLMKDEQPNEYGTGTERLSGQLDNAEKVLRRFQISVGYNSPTNEVHIHHFILRTIYRDWLAKGKEGRTMCVLYQPSDLNTPEDADIMGFVWVDFPKKHMDIVNEYEKLSFSQKQQIITGENSLKKMWEKHADDFLKEYKEDLGKLKDRDIMTIIKTKIAPNLAGVECIEISRIIKLKRAGLWK